MGGAGTVMCWGERGGGEECWQCLYGPEECWQAVFGRQQMGLRFDHKVSACVTVLHSSSESVVMVFTLLTSLWL